MELTGLLILIVVSSLVCAVSNNQFNDISSRNLNESKIIARDEWSAQPPANKLLNLQLPVQRVILMHTATKGCDTQAQCIERVRMIQAFHMDSKKWDDIGYNFLVGGDEAIYEGRGWNKQGAHTKGYNAGSIGIALIGTFTKQSPPQTQLDSLKLLFAEGVRLGKLSDDFKLYPHRAFFDTESPGDQVIKIIEHWPNYIDKFE